MNDERLTALEEMVAHQTRQIEDMSDEITKQWTTIDHLKRKLENLTEQYSSLEDQLAGPQDNKPPPHY